MNPNFPDWYRVAGIEPPDRRLKDRWKGLDQFCRDMPPAEAVMLSELFATGTTSLEFQTRLRLALQDADDSFGMEGNNVELRVVAGASLAHLIENGSGPIADFCALALVCDEFCGHRPSFVPAITQTARLYLRTRSATLRNGEGVVNDLGRPPDVSKIEGGSDTTEELKELAVFADKLATLALTVSQRQILYREESNILWWAYSEWSRDFDTPFKDLPAQSAPFVLGKELADLTLALPGPTSTKGFLWKALHSVSSDTTKKLALSVAVNLTSHEWKHKVITQYVAGGLARFLPVLAALKESDRASNSDGWLTTFQKEAGLASEPTIEPLRLALQMYHECLLVRANNALIALTRMATA